MDRKEILLKSGDDSRVECSTLTECYIYILTQKKWKCTPIYIFPLLMTNLTFLNGSEHFQISTPYKVHFTTMHWIGGRVFNTMFLCFLQRLEK